jgi:hypothetical protein
MKKVKQKKKTLIPLESLYRFGLDSGEYKALYEQETHMSNLDRIVIETSEARNALEGYYLEMRGLVEDPSGLGAFVTEQDREAFVDLCRKAENWLDGDGWDAQKSQYVKELEELKKVGGPIQKRKWESENRSSTADALKHACLKYQRWVSNNEEKYAHITPEKRSEVDAKAKEVDNWLVTALIQQEKLPKTSDPSLACATIQQKQRELTEFCDKIINAPKPKPKKEEPKENKQTAADDSSKSKKAKKTQEKDGAAASTEENDAGQTTQNGDTPAADAAPMDTSS